MDGEKPKEAIECPKCGCRDVRLTDRRVTKIWHKGGVVVRRRMCRHCGYRMTTTERPMPD